MMLGLQLGQITLPPHVIEYQQVQEAIASMDLESLCNAHQKLWSERETLANVRKQKLSASDRAIINTRYSQLSGFLSLIRAKMYRLGETMASLKRCEAPGQTFAPPSSEKPPPFECNPGAPYGLKLSARRMCNPGERPGCTRKMGPNTCTCCPPQAPTQIQFAEVKQTTSSMQDGALPEPQQEEAQSAELSSQPQTMPIYTEAPSFMPGPVTRMPPAVVSQQEASAVVPAILKTDDTKKKNLIVAGIIGAALLLA